MFAFAKHPRIADVLHLLHVNDVYASSHWGQLVTSFITTNSSWLIMLFARLAFLSSIRRECQVSLVLSSNCTPPYNQRPICRPQSVVIDLSCLASMNSVFLVLLTLKVLINIIYHRRNIYWTSLSKLRIISYQKSTDLDGTRIGESTSKSIRPVF